MMKTGIYFKSIPPMDSNTIQEASENGINVAQHSFTGILNHMIQDKQDTGIRMLDGSSARIGFMDLAQSARGNAIRRNGAAGVLVQGSSGASLVANDISENDGPGVSVRGASHADLAGNQINGNGSDGVAVTQNSFVQLGDLPGLLSPPNDTTAPNMGFGLSCSLDSSVDGQLGDADRYPGSEKIRQQLFQYSENLVEISLGEVAELQEMMGRSLDQKRCGAQGKRADPCGDH